MEPYSQTQPQMNGPQLFAPLSNEPVSHPQTTGMTVVSETRTVPFPENRGIVRRTTRCFGLFKKRTRCSKCNQIKHSHPRLLRVVFWVALLISLLTIFEFIFGHGHHHDDHYDDFHHEMMHSHFAALTLENQADAIAECSGDFVVLFEAAPIVHEDTDYPPEMEDHHDGEFLDNEEDMLEQFKLPEGYLHSDQWELLNALDTAVTGRAVSVHLVSAPQQAQDHVSSYTVPTTNHASIEEAVAATTENQVCVITPRYAMNSAKYDVEQHIKSSQSVEVQRLPWSETHHALIETAIHCDEEFIRLDIRGVDLEEFEHEFEELIEEMIDAAYEEQHSSHEDDAHPDTHSDSRPPRRR